MIESFNVPEEKVSFWAGITSTVFSFSQALTGIFWGRLSDRFGRKPIILTALTCVLLSALLFGFSQSLIWAIIARAVGGASNGNVGILRTVVAEIVTTKELQPRAFSIMPLVWSLGSIFGPILGGALANPAARYPSLFGQNQFFIRFPFALPNLVCSIFFLISLGAGFLFMKESLESKKHRPDVGRSLAKLLLHALRPWAWQRTSGKDAEREPLLPERSSSTSTIEGGKDASRNRDTRGPPTYREVFNTQASLNLLAYTLLAFHSVTYDQILPVFMHYPRQESRQSNPNVQLPLKFSGGFGIDVSPSLIAQRWC